MAWQSPRTWVSSEVVTAAQMNAHVRDNLLALNGFVRKTADESVTSSATLQNDNELTIAIPAAGSYVIDLRLYGSSAANAAGDLRVGFTFPTGTFHFGVGALDSSLASGAAADLAATGNLSATSGSTVLGIGLSTTVTYSKVEALLIATAAGTLQMQWAQLASNANASTIKAGSHMRMAQVA